MKYTTEIHLRVETFALQNKYTWGNTVFAPFFFFLPLFYLVFFSLLLCSDLVFFIFYCANLIKACCSAETQRSVLGGIISLSNILLIKDSYISYLFLLVDKKIAVSFLCGGARLGGTTVGVCVCVSKIKKNKKRRSKWRKITLSFVQIFSDK